MRHHILPVEEKAQYLWETFEAENDQIFWKKYEALIEDSKSTNPKIISIVNPAFTNQSLPPKKQSHIFYPYKRFLFVTFLWLTIITLVPILIIVNLNIKIGIISIILAIIPVGSIWAISLASILSFKLTHNEFIFSRTFVFDKSIIELSEIRHMAIIRQTWRDNNGKIQYYHLLVVYTYQQPYEFPYNLTRQNHDKFQHVLSEKNIALDAKDFRL